MVRDVVLQNELLPARDDFYTCADGGLGHGIPAAIGVALARPGEKVIALFGHDASIYAIQGLGSAAQLALPISFIIVKCKLANMRHLVPAAEARLLAAPACGASGTDASSRGLSQSLPAVDSGRFRRIAICACLAGPRSSVRLWPG